MSKKRVYLNGGIVFGRKKFDGLFQISTLKNKKRQPSIAFGKKILKATKLYKNRLKVLKGYAFRCFFIFLDDIMSYTSKFDLFRRGFYLILFKVDKNPLKHPIYYYYVTHSNNKYEENRNKIP